MALENKIESVKVQGFRSLADVELANIPDAAVLIGPNGSGKSNVFLFLEMLQQMLCHRRLNQFVRRHGGADDQLFGGSSQTPTLSSQVRLKYQQRTYNYECSLSYIQPDEFSVEQERGLLYSEERAGPVGREILNWGKESGIFPIDPQNQSNFGTDDSFFYESSKKIRDFLGGWSFHQFHNTGFHSDIKKWHDIEDNVGLNSDGSNLASVLYRLEREDERLYNYICQQISRVLPSFDRFAVGRAYGKAMLRWKAVNYDKPMGAHLTSDGSLRAFALLTLLNLPADMLPSVVFLDEPELGLHPSAISLLGGMIKVLSVQRQVILATQSPLLVDSFDLDQIFVLDLKDGQTKISRPNSEELRDWLEEYSTGGLWQTNIIGGRP
ncbi:MAG: AAA family ATPase [Chloroflexota bacterium]|nr:AAA family ATPase [Chloroflexota bacterium]